MLLHRHTPRPSQGWGATKVDLGLVLHSPSTGTMGDHLSECPLHQRVKKPLYSCIVQSCHLARSDHSFFVFALSESRMRKCKPYIMLTWCLSLTAALMKSPVSSAAGMPPPPVSSQYNPNVQQNGAHPQR